MDQEWKIAKSGALCCACDTPFNVIGGEPPPRSYYSVLLQKPDGLVRQDFCLDCFKNKRPANVYYFWKAMPPSEDTAARRQPVVDVEYVLEFFKRLEGDAAPQRIAFRYILALMLSRKKLLIPEGKDGSENGMEIHVFREKRGGASHRVFAPELNQDEIAAVSDELGALLGLPSKQPACDTGIAVLPVQEEGIGGQTSMVSVDTSATVGTAENRTDTESIRRTAK